MSSRIHQVLAANTDTLYTITPTSGFVEVTNHGIPSAQDTATPVYVEIGAAATVRGNDTRAVSPGQTRIVSTGNRTGTVVVHVISAVASEVSVEAITPGAAGFFR